MDSEVNKQERSVNAKVNAETVVRYRYVVKRDVLNNPEEKLWGITVTLPQGLSARFIRSGSWRSCEHGQNSGSGTN